ncbi:MAG: TlpA family protein disulfide reductase [Sphingobacteriia bacterium]|nr:TlpA family protein disulfide reductase [Sphingobacteriia bacterium]
MRTTLLIILILYAIGSPVFSQPKNYGKPVIRPSAIVKDVMSWLVYERDYMNWSADYIPLDTSLHLITKKQFLESLTTGQYLPVRIESDDSSICYQLVKLDRSVDNEIKMVIKNKSLTEHQYYNMEGTPLPNFNFICLNDSVYNTNTAKNKIVVLNCWFIHCAACVAEIPELNKLVSRYKERTDILFLALAFDPAKDLKAFLKKTTFKYQVVADKTDYLMNELKIAGYPTHLIVNREGKIIKVTNNFNEVISGLNKEISK